jgi:hypothetical protein
MNIIFDLDDLDLLVDLRSKISELAQRDDHLKFWFRVRNSNLIYATKFQIIDFVITSDHQFDFPEAFVRCGGTRIRNEFDENYADFVEYLVRIFELFFFDYYSSFAREIDPENEICERFLSIQISSQETLNSVSAINSLSQQFDSLTT